MRSRLVDTGRSLAALSELPALLRMLVRELPPPIRVTRSNGGFVWQFPERSARVMAVCMLSRSASALGASRTLCEAGFTVEAAALLRMISDFTLRVTALCEAIRSEVPTSAQKRLIDTFFRQHSETREANETQKGPRFVGRKDLERSEDRLLTQAGLYSSFAVALRDEVTLGFDGYVHGDYSTAMKLFRGDRGEFEVLGKTEDSRAKEATERAIGIKIYQVLLSFELLARALGLRDLLTTSQALRRHLETH